VLFSHPLYSLDPAPTNFFPFPNVKLNFRWRFHNVENLKKVTCELNILPVDVWWLFHAASRKNYVTVKVDYLEGKETTVFFLFNVCLLHSLNLRNALRCIYHCMLQDARPFWSRLIKAYKDSRAIQYGLKAAGTVSYICINNSNFIRK